MTKEERSLYDAKAKEEAWGYAENILRPWVEAAQAIGSDELTWVMEEALEKTQREFFRAQDELATRRGGISGSGAG